MIVVSDTTPPNYLILIDSVHVLPTLFGRVYAPSAVMQELSHPKTPERFGRGRAARPHGSPSKTRCKPIPASSSIRVKLRPSPWPRN